MALPKFSPRLPSAKKITPEVLKANPLLAKLARIRAKQLKEAKSGK